MVLEKLASGFSFFREKIMSKPLKIIIVILVMAALVFSAAKLLPRKEIGQIENLNKDLYYAKTDYKDQVFILRDVINDGQNKRVAFSTEETLPEASADIKAGTYICETLSEEEFNELIGDYDLFEADLSILTAIDPKTGKIYTCISSGSLEADLRKVATREYAYEVPKDRINGYIKDNNMIYIKV